MNTYQKDPYLNGLSHFDDLESQVNNVISGKAPNSIDFKKILKNPMVYLIGCFVIFMTILWVWSPGWLKQDDSKNIKIWLVILISIILSGISSGALWFFWLRKISVD